MTGGISGMNLSFRLSVILALSLALMPPARAQTNGPATHAQVSNNVQPSSTGAPTNGTDDRRSDAGETSTTTGSARAPVNNGDPVSSDPLVRVLVTKGVLTPEEGRAVSAGSTPAGQRDRLAALLRDKGLISTAEFEAIRTVAPS